MAKFIKTFEQPDEIITAFADDLGYQEQVINPDYELTVDPDTLESTDNGEPNTINNPQTRQEFVSEKCDGLIATWLMSFAERNAMRNATEQVKAGVGVQLKTLKESISTVIE